MQAFYLISSSQNLSSDSLLTLCSDFQLSQHHILSIDDVRTIAWIVKAEHANIPALSEIRYQAQHLELDINPFSPEQTPKKLLIADMDATIIRGESLDELASLSGYGDEIAAITKRTMAGDIDFETGLNMRLSKLAGQPASLLDQVIQNTRITDGADILLATMRSRGAECLLVSGGFTFLTKHVANTLGFSGHHANQLGIENGRLTGTAVPPILTKTSKAEILKKALNRLGLTADAALCVGDGANDIDMLGSAGLGVGFEPKPAVRKVINTHLDYTDLTGLLYLQGLSYDEFATP